MMLDKLIQKIDEYKTQPFFDQFHDIRVVGLWAFLFILLLMSWSGVKVIQTNYELQKQISQLKQEDAVQRLANANLKLQNQYFNTNQYLELAARQNFGLGRPGETLLIVPANVAQKHLSGTTTDKKSSPSGHQPFYQRNFQAWMNFFLNRQGSV